MAPKIKTIDIPMDWYKPGKSIAEFHEDGSWIRVLMGGRGCGKTFASMTEAVKHCWFNVGARVRVFRKWGSSNEDSVKDTLMEIFKNMGEYFIDTGRTLFAIKDGGSRFRVPSSHAISLWIQWNDENPEATVTQKENWLNTIGERFCGHIICDGLPDADKANAKTRSNQCSMMIFVEADQIEESYVSMGIGSVRLLDANGKRFVDAGIIIESNPPSTKHWIAKWENGDFSDPEHPQEPMRRCKFWHIPTKENEHIMGKNYVQNLIDQYRYKPDEYERFVLGNYADVYPGSPVIKTFNAAIHCRKNLGFPRGATLVRGWDYGGSNNACLWMAYFIDEAKYEHFWALKELWLQNSTIEEQATEVLRITKEDFPDTNDKTEVNAIYDFGDIAGGQKSATGSVTNVLSTFGVYPGATKMNIQESLAMVLRLMSARDNQDRPLFLIDPIHCPKLTQALKGEYRYPIVGEPGYGAAVQEPLKGEACNNADHITDTLRYSVANMFRLLKIGTKGPLKGGTKVNPKKIMR